PLLHRGDRLFLHPGRGQPNDAQSLLLTVARRSPTPPWDFSWPLRLPRTLAILAGSVSQRPILEFAPHCGSAGADSPDFAPAGHRGLSAPTIRRVHELRRQFVRRDGRRGFVYSIGNSRAQATPGFASNDLQRRGHLLPSTRTGGRQGVDGARSGSQARAEV